MWGRRLTQMTEGALLCFILLTVVFAMKNVMSMPRFLKLFVVFVAICCLCACEDEPDYTNPEANLSVTINADGTASNGAVYSQIDGTTFMLDFVKYEIDDSHLWIIGYDKDQLPDIPRLYAFVTINGTTYKTKIIRYAAFFGARMTSLVLPETLTDIEDSAFSDCVCLLELYVPNGVKDIGCSAFRRCSSLQSFDFPEALTMIDAYAFYGCASLQELHLPKAAISIEYNAFGGCRSLRRVDFPDGLIAIRKFAFRDCPLLLALDFPKTLTTIDEYAFGGCVSLKNVAFSKSLTYIREGAFYACRTLQNVEFPESLTNIGSEAFKECDNLKTVKFLGMTPPNLDYDAFSGTPKAYVRPDALPIYQAWTYRDCFSEILPIE